MNTASSDICLTSDSQTQDTHYSDILNATKSSSISISFGIFTLRRRCNASNMESNSESRRA